MLNQHTTNTYQRARGFTIIESMVAISILFLAITGPIALMNESIQSARLARDRVQATYLAQEGVELVRNIRDNDALAGASSWLGTLEGDNAHSAVCVGANISCAYHPLDTNNLVGGQGVCGDECPPLTIRSDGTLTLNTTLEPSRFSRSVRVTETVADREVLVVSTVRWFAGTDQQSVVVEDVLLDWQL